MCFFGFIVIFNTLNFYNGVMFLSLIVELIFYVYPSKLGKLAYKIFFGSNTLYITNQIFFFYLC